MFKKFLSLTLALVMALGLVAGAVDYKDADDISDYAEDAVQTVHDLNIMQGDNHGNFNPKEPITREQMFRVMYAVHNAGDINISSLYEALLTSSYKDADQVATWARAFAGYNVSKQIFKGDGAGMLRPKASISYQEVAVLFLRALGYKDDYITGYNPLFSWGQNALLLAHEAGIMKGLPSISNPAAAATREDVAVMATNALGAKTVSYDKDEGYTTNEDKPLIKVKYGLEKAEDAERVGIVEEYVSDAYVLQDDTEYTDKNFDSNLIGRKVKWTVSKVGGTEKVINKIAAVADDKFFEDVKLADISVSIKEVEGDEDVLCTIKLGKTELIKEVSVDKLVLRSVGNGVREVNNLPAEEFQALFNGTAEPLKVDISYNKVGEDFVITVFGVHDEDSFGFAKVTDIKKNNVVEFDEDVFAIANDLTGISKNDFVYFTVDYADMLAGENDEIAKDLKVDAIINVNLTKVSAVAVEAEKFAKKTVDGDPTYSIDGNKVVEASTAKDTVANFFDDLEAKKVYYVYAIDEFVYNIVVQEAGEEEPDTVYGYGFYLSSVYNANGAFIKLLTADGNETELPISKVDSKKATRTDSPVDYDVVTLQPIFGVDELHEVTKNTFVTYEADGNKYKVYTTEVKVSTGESKEDAAGKTISKSEMKIGTDRFTDDTVFFVKYKDGEEKEQIKVLRGSDVQNQAGTEDAEDLVKGSYVKVPVVKGASVKVAKVVYLDLSGITFASGNMTLFTVVVKADTTMLLTSKPVMITQPGAKDKVEFTGLVAGELKTLTYEVNEQTIDAVDKGDLITLKVTNDKLTDKVEKVSGKSFLAINEYLSVYPNEITLATDGFKKLDSKVKIYYLDKDYKVVDAYSFEIVESEETKTHEVMVVAESGGAITEMYVKEIKQS